MFYQGDNGLLVSLLSTNKRLGAICPASHAQCSAQLFVPGLLCWLSKLELEILNVIFFFFFGSLNILSSHGNFSGVYCLE